MALCRDGIIKGGINMEGNPFFRIFWQYVGWHYNGRGDLYRGTSEYPEELKIKDTRESDKSASYLEILLNIVSNDRLTTSQYDKRDDFDFAIVNVPFLCRNVPLSPAYGVYVSQLIRSTRACFAYDDFSKRGNLLTKKLMLQGYNRKKNRYFAQRSWPFSSIFIVLYLLFLIRPFSCLL
jgi:hypothetical protein